MTLKVLWALRRESASLPDTLTTLSGFAALRGEDADARALADAAAQLSVVEPRARVALLRPLLGGGDTTIPGLAPGAIAAIRSIVTDGREAALAQARARLAPDLARLLLVPGVSLDDVVTVHRRTGAVTAGDLAAAVGTIGHPAVDVDEDLRQRLEAALPNLRRGHPRVPLGRALATLERLRLELAHTARALVDVQVTGSARRFEPTVGDLELIAASEAPVAAVDALLRRFDAAQVLHRGRRLLSVVIEGDPVAVRVVSPEEFPFALHHYTGTAEHVRQVRRRALARGWQLSASGLSATNGAAPSCRSERDIYEHLGLDFVPPELRHGEDELAVAERRALPALVSADDIRGDLHVHTLWSDGRDSVEMMVRAARALGYQYVAITDHSPHAAASRVLTLDRLERQREDIESARRRVSDITVLHGVEVDILPDGSLDFPDAVLEGLDLVLASLHEPVGQTPDELLGRYLAALRHPRVHVITHPANRLVGRDSGYDLDYDALFAAAVRTGTVLEIDGGPAHLDMDGHLARRAIAAGVTVSIDSDCHNSHRLGLQMAMGVGTARRGGVAARHVINTRPLGEVLAYFAAKPARLRALDA